VKKIFLILLLTTSASLALAAPFKRDVVADTTVDKNTLKKILHWVSVFTMYSSVDLSDKIDLQEYAKASDMLQSFVQNPELSAHLNGFRKATFVNVYPKGMLNGQEWILKKLNEISDAQYNVLNAPYLTVEVWFTPDATAQSYTVTALFKTTDEKLNASVAKVNPILSGALLGKTYAQPRLAKNEVNAALFAALDALQAEIGNAFAPNIAIGYNNNIYTNNQTIEVWQKANEGITLRAVDKNDVLLAGPVTWTGVVGTGTTVRFPITKVGHERVTLKAGKDQVSVLMNVKEFNIDLNSLLRKLIVEVLTAKKKKAIDTLATLRQDSIANVSEIARRITELEQYNFPLETTGVTLTPFFADPVTLTDSSAFLNATGGDKRAGSFSELRKRKKIHKVLRHTLNIAAFADLVVKDQNRFNTLLDDLLKNSGQLIANLILGKDSKGQEDVARSIVIDYLNKNLERLASPDALIPDPPLPVPPAVAPALAPTFDATKYLYISPQVQFAGRDAFVKQLEDSLRKGKTYAFINYSQDVSTTAYLTRAKGARPKGVPQDAKYKVYTWLNIPGSVKEQVISRGKGSTAGSAKEAILADVFGAEDEIVYTDDEYFSKLLQQIRCAYASGLDEVPMPEKYKSGGNGEPITFDYGLPTSQSEINGLKLRNGWWSAEAKKDKITGIKNPAIDASKGDIVFGGFKIKVPVAAYSMNSSITPFVHLTKYLFPKEQDVIVEFNKVWEGGIKQKVESNKEISGEDITRLKDIASCATKYIDVESRYRLIQAIMNYSTSEYYEDLVLDILQTTPKGDQSKKLFTSINSNKALLIRIITKMDNLWGNEKNFDRLAKEYLALFQNGYNQSEQLVIYKSLADDKKLFFYGFGSPHCEWDIEASRDDENVTFEETEIFDYKPGNYIPNQDGSSLATCRKEERKYSVPLRGFVSVNFSTASFISEKNNRVLMPAMVYYAMIKSKMNEQLYNSAVVAWTVLSTITPYDEFYLLGKALQYGSKGFRALRLSNVKVLSKASRIEVPLTVEGKGLKDLSDGKIDEYVKWGDEVAKGTDDMLRSVAKVEDDLRKVVGKEHIYKIDTKGNVKGPIVGEPDKVDFTNLGPFNKGDILTHNHPSGSTFSEADIFNLSATEITELRAVTGNKIYSIKKIGDFNYIKWYGNYQNLIDQFKIKYANKIKNGLTFEERVIMQEELFKESFKGYNVQFLIQ
jgi:hypothetical protein